MMIDEKAKDALRTVLHPKLKKSLTSIGTS